MTLIPVLFEFSEMETLQGGCHRASLVQMLLVTTWCLCHLLMMYATTLTCYQLVGKRHETQLNQNRHVCKLLWTHQA